MNINYILSKESAIMDKKAALFEAAKELFLQKGFKDINVSDITKKQGLA